MINLFYKNYFVKLIKTSILSNSALIIAQPIIKRIKLKKSKKNCACQTKNKVNKDVKI